MAQTIAKAGVLDRPGLADNRRSAISSGRRFRALPSSGAVMVIGLTATPIVKGLRETWETVVNATTTDALVADGQLAPVEIYAATEINMKGAAKTAGEWTARRGPRTERSRSLVTLCPPGPSTPASTLAAPPRRLLFSADIAHGEDLCRGVPSGWLSTFDNPPIVTPTRSPRRWWKGSEEAQFTGLVSVAKFVKGFDVPDVLIGVDARPNSRSLARGRTEAGPCHAVQSGQR